MAAGTQPDSRPSATPPNAAPRTNTTSARLSSNAPCRVALPSRRASGPSSRSLAAPTVQSSRGVQAPPGRSTERASASGNPTPAATRARVSASAARDTAGPPRDGSALRSLRDLDRTARAVTPQEQRIEADDGAFDVLARVGDVESRRAGDEVREQH